MPEDPTFLPIEQALTESVERFVTAHNLASEGLTNQQLAAVIRQAIQCGDIKKFTRVSDNATAIVYVPNADHHLLIGKINRLEKALKENGIKHPDEHPDQLD